MGIFTSTSKRRKRYYENINAKFQNINEKYQLNIEKKDLEHIAWAIADNQTQASKGIFGGFNFLGAIFTVIGSIATGGTLGAIMGAVGLASNKIITSNSIKGQNLALKALNIQSQTAFKKGLNDSKNKSDLSYIESFKGYANYADGNIYKQGQAGSQSFSPSLAYDPTKGLRQDYTQSQTDEATQNRSHYTQSGNEGFINDLSQGYIQEPSENLSTQESQEALFLKAKTDNERILKGFSELCFEGLNFLNTANLIYEKVTAKQIHPTLRQISTLDFLEKNKNYQKALRLELSLNFNDLAKTSKESQQQAQNRLKEQESFKRVLEEDFKKFLNESQEVKNLLYDIETLKNKLQTLKPYTASYNKTSQALIYVNDTLEALKANTKKDLEKKLFESEKALMQEPFYIQKSRLFTSQEKKENYMDMIHAQLDLFFLEISHLTTFKNDPQLNNATFFNQDLFYNENSTWQKLHSLKIEDILNQLYPQDTDDNLIDFYENILLKNFSKLTFKDKSQQDKDAFFLVIQDQLYLKTTTQKEILTEKIYKGF